MELEQSFSVLRTVHCAAYTLSYELQYVHSYMALSICVESQLYLSCAWYELQCVCTFVQGIEHCAVNPNPLNITCIHSMYYIVQEFLVVPTDSAVPWLGLAAAAEKGVK